MGNLQFYTQNSDTINTILGLVLGLIGMWINDKRPDLIPFFNESRKKIEQTQKALDGVIKVINDIEHPNSEFKKVAAEKIAKQEIDPAVAQVLDANLN